MDLDECLKDWEDLIEDYKKLEVSNVYYNKAQLKICTILAFIYLIKRFADIC